MGVGGCGRGGGDRGRLRARGVVWEIRAVWCGIRDRSLYLERLSYSPPFSTSSVAFCWVVQRTTESPEIHAGLIPGCPSLRGIPRALRAPRMNFNQQLAVLKPRCASLMLLLGRNVKNIKQGQKIPISSRKQNATFYANP